MRQLLRLLKLHRRLCPLPKCLLQPPKPNLWLYPLRSRHRRRNLPRRSRRHHLAPPPPLADGVVQEPFAAWKKVVAAMEAKDQLLFVYLRNSNAFYDGKRVLIDGSDLFLEYMRKNDYSADLIKKTIAEVTGTRYAIGPYKRKRQEEEARQSAEDVLSQLERQGVEIVYENE